MEIRKQLNLRTGSQVFTRLLLLLLIAAGAISCGSQIIKGRPPFISISGMSLIEGKLSAGHAKVLLGLEIAEERLLLARQAVAEGTSVRALEKLVAKATRPARKPRAMRVDIPTAHVSHIVDSLRRKFGTSVKVTSCTTLANGKKAKGSIAIDYYSVEDLDRILEVLGIVEDETMP